MATDHHCPNQRPIVRRAANWMLVALGISFIALIARVGEITHDAFHEMALFREFAQLGVFPWSDVFAYTPTVNPCVHHEWGTGAVLYFVTTTTGLGLPGLTLLKFALIGTMWAMLYQVARCRGVHPYLFALLAVTVFPLLWVGFATIRATLFTLMFLSVQLWFHELDRRGHRLWLIAWWCLLVAWLNVHAGFIVGVGLLGLHALQRGFMLWAQTGSLRKAWYATWHLSLCIPLVLLALPINPYGLQYLPYLVRAISMPRPQITEWLPLWHTHQPVTTMFMFGISIVWIIISVRRQSLANLLGLLGLCVCAVLALKHLRHGPIYSVLWLAYVPAWVSHTRFGRDLVARIHAHPLVTLRLAQSVSAACLIWALTNQCWQTTLSGDCARQSTCYPVRAAEYLAANDFQGNLLTPFHAGAFISWQLHPQVKVSLDGRYEVAYAPQVFDEHWKFFEAKADWARLLDQYPHDAILVNQSAKVRPLLEVFRESPDKPQPTTERQLTTGPQPSNSQWKFVFEDDAYVILARTDIALPYEDHRGAMAQSQARSTARTRHTFVRTSQRTPVTPQAP